MRIRAPCLTTILLVVFGCAGSLTNRPEAAQAIEEPDLDPPFPKGNPNQEVGGEGETDSAAPPSATRNDLRMPGDWSNFDWNPPADDVEYRIYFVVFANRCAAWVNTYADHLADLPPRCRLIFEKIRRSCPVVRKKVESGKSTKEAGANSLCFDDDMPPRTYLLESRRHNPQ